MSEDGAAHCGIIDRDFLLMVCIGGSIGKAAMTDRDVCCNQQINALTPVKEIAGGFLLSCLRSNYFQGFVRSTFSQTTLPIISKGKWEQLRVPLPPLAEQKRIVAKVEQLLALCDELETRLKDVDARHERLLAAAVHDVLSPGTC